MPPREVMSLQEQACSLHIVHAPWLLLQTACDLEQEVDHKSFIRACLQGHAEGAHLLLEAGAGTDLVRTAYKALLEKAKTHHATIMRLLLEAGANNRGIDSPDEARATWRSCSCSRQVPQKW